MLLENKNASLSIENPRVLEFPLHQSFIRPQGDVSARGGEFPLPFFSFSNIYFPSLPFFVCVLEEDNNKLVI